MPTYRSYQGRLADRYQRRAASVGRETAKLRGAVAVLLKKGLQDATQEELYDRTTLKVSHRMMNSIRVKMMGDSVQVGYFYWPPATRESTGKAIAGDYAKYRINMTGTSKQDGHVLDMHPALWIKKNVDPDIQRLQREALRAIRETK